MVTVRFSDGTSFQYNTATSWKYVTQNGLTFVRLFYKRGEDHVTVADVIGACVIDFNNPCRAYNPVKGSGDVFGLADRACA
jgi:hypothetical protein